MTRDLRLLVLEDVPADLALIGRELAADGLACTVRPARTRAEFLAALDEEAPDLILSDHGLPDFDGLAALQEARARRPRVPFVFLSGPHGEENVIESFRRGAADYVLKGHPGELGPAIRQALRRTAGDPAPRPADPGPAVGAVPAAAVIEASLDAVVVLDAEGHILGWNPAAERTFGYSRELALGRDFAALALPPGADGPDRGLARLLHGGRGRQLGHRTELTAVRAHGAEFPAEVTLARLPGEPAAFAAFIRDLTERRRAEEALRRNEERFRLLVEGVEGHAIFLLDPHGRIATWNPGAERLTGHRAADVIGRRFHRCFTSADAASGQPDQALAVANAEGRFADERPLLRADGTTFPARFAVTAVRDAERRPAGFSVFIEDNSAAQAAADETRRRLAELARRDEAHVAARQRLQQEAQAFLHSLSHDLRAPLVRINGFATMLREDLEAKLDDDSRRHLRTITDSADQLGRMLTGLLACERIGQAKLHRSRVPLGELVREIVRELSPPDPERRLTWTIGDLPDVDADAGLLRQALTQLLGNAVKFTRTRAEGRIEVGARTGEGETVVTIRDNGVGFDPAGASRLFGPFQRLHGAAFEGQGIGLALVRRIIGRHGGRAWAEGTPDGGATFSFSLPEEAVP